MKDGVESDEARQRTDLRNAWHLPHTPSSSQLSSLTIQLHLIPATSGELE